MKKRILTCCGFCLVYVFQANAPAQTITSQPQSITVNNASTAMFAVGAGGATNYQWQFNGTNLSDAGNITGSTNSTLILEDVNTNEAGSYTVIVNGSVTSSNAVLTIMPGTIVQFTLSGFLGGGASNVNVQLFDHDKPATVANFLHYIRSGAFSNMFFERCVPNFVLQGGGYGAADRTNTSPPMTGWDIPSMFTDASNQPSPPFPHQVDNEFNVGPLIHNRAGTIAMALGPDTNSAGSAFFFNLVDNSGYPNHLDAQDFTVFGRILDGTGTNVLQYFNALNNGSGMVTNGSGIVTNGEFFDDALQFTNQTITNLPVNYDGTNAPANANLVFCDFQLPTNAPVDTNPPTVLITSPAPNVVLTNGHPVIQGTASDDVGLAVVICALVPQAAADGTLPNGGVSITNYAVGTTNWSVNFLNRNDPFYELVPPGSYSLSVWAQDGAGNLSPAMVQLLIITAIYANGNGTVTLTNNGFTNLNAVGYTFQNRSNYNLVATPDTNQVFLNWTYLGRVVGVSPELRLPMADGLVLAATFITNGIPNSIAFTYPPPGAIISNNIFNITGTISNAPATPLIVTCHIYSTTTYSPAAGTPLTNSGTTNWSVTVSNLPPDSYSVEAVAVDTNGNGTVISEDFTVAYNSPVISILYPATNAVLTDNSSLTVNGTVSDSVGLVRVQCYLIPVSNSDRTFPNGGMPFGTNTIGTTNWSLNFGIVPPGAYNIYVNALDEVGNTSSQGQPLTNTAILIKGNGSVSLTQGTNAITNPIGYPLQNGVSYEVTATPGAGQAFVGWSAGAYTTTNPVQTFTMSAGLLWTATFVPTNTGKGISFTYPTANARLTTNTFLLKGRMTPSFKSASVSCQISSLTTGFGVGPLLAASGTTTWSAGVSNLPPDNYLVEALATNATGLTTIISEKFSILAFTEAAGTYSGLFISTNSPVAPTNSGFLTFTVGPSGIFSGRLVFPAYPPIPINSLPFENIDFTTGFVPFGFSDFYGHPLNGTIYLDLTGRTDTALGTISSDAWSSQLICHRAVTKLSTNTTPATGKYILSLQSGNQTNGTNTTNGCASLSVARNGFMALSGALPDNTIFSQSTRVSKDGIWPLYAIPAGDRTNGVLMGWETNSASGSCNGQLFWYKASNLGAYYRSGVGVESNMLLNASGTNYSRPVTGSRYSIIFAGGTIMPPLTNTLEVNEAAQFVVSGSPADRLKISLSTSGVLTGSILNPNNNKTLRFKGAFIGPSQGGSGFIPDADGQTGSFELELALP